MTAGAPTILNASILIVDDQESNEAGNRCLIGSAVTSGTGIVF